MAAAAPCDSRHAECVDLLSRLPEPPVISPFVAIEVCYFLSTRAAPAEAAFLRSIAVGTFQLADVTDLDMIRCAELVER